MLNTDRVYCIPYSLAKKPAPIKVEMLPINKSVSDFKPNYKPKSNSTKIAEQYLSFNRNMIIHETDNDDDTLKAD